MDLKAYEYITKNNLVNDHWWFRGREKIVKSALSNYLSYKKDNLILDIGSGLGQFFPILKEFGKVFGVERNKTFADISIERYPFATIYNDSYPSNKIDIKKFNIICMFDFLEHLEVPDIFLKELSGALKSNSLVIISVPAYMFLWSDIDEISEHYHRFNSKEINKLFSDNNYECVYKTYFMTLLFPLVLISRKIIQPLIRNKKFLFDFESSKKGLINSICFKIFQFESFFIRKKIALPFGLSILGIFKKK